MIISQYSHIYVSFAFWLISGTPGSLFATVDIMNEVFI